MLDCLRIRLDARAADDRRAYDIRIGCDLFSHWTIVLRHGPVGRAGRVQRFVATSQADACRVVGERLARPAIAHRYRLCEISAAESLDLVPWLRPICALLTDDGRTERGGRGPLDNQLPATPASEPKLRLPFERPTGRTAGEVVDLAVERRRVLLARTWSKVAAARDELLDIYAAAPEPSDTGEVTAVLIERCDLLLGLIEQLAELERPDPDQKS
ncbi:MAG TPA: hypothetical protein VFO41_04965 [Alphaproteobacteria bacterium]|nr:hypothetical protein [Alphaproteobacteria bacterium]